MTTVNVTREHIERGKPRNCARCPIALALREILADGFFAEITPDVAWITPEVTSDPRWSGELPEAAKRFIERFDEEDYGGNHWPFSFDLDIPAELLRPGGRA